MSRRDAPLGEQSNLPTLPNLADEFIERQKVRSLSVRTVQHHKDCLRRFLSWCKEREIAQPAEVTKKLLQRYQRQLFYYRKTNGQPLAPSTQHMHLVAIRAFFSWLTKQDFIAANPAADLDLPKVPKRLPRGVPTRTEVQTLMTSVQPASPIAIRDRAILELLYATGMRRMELICLSNSDLDIDRQTAFIREGKGKRDRMLPIGERAALWAAKYRDQARCELVTEPDCSALFLSRWGKAISPNALSRVVSERFQKAGFTDRGACHVLRHACATHMLEGGADIRYIQAMLGHGSLSTTEIYTQVAIKALKAAHAASHPAATLGRHGTSSADDDSSPV